MLELVSSFQSFRWFEQDHTFTDTNESRSVHLEAMIDYLLKSVQDSNYLEMSKNRKGDENGIIRYIILYCIIFNHFYIDIY